MADGNSDALSDKVWWLSQLKPGEVGPAQAPRLWCCRGLTLVPGVPCDLGLTPVVVATLTTAAPGLTATPSRRLLSMVGGHLSTSC